MLERSGAAVGGNLGVGAACQRQHAQGLVGHGLVGRQYLGALGVKLLGRVEGIISLAIGQELVYILLVDVATLTLAVGTMVATEADALVKLDAEPLE